MAFKKLSRATRKKLSHPAIYITTSTSTLNMAFCQAVGMKELDDKVGIDLLYDEETDQFGIKVWKNKPEKGDVLAKYNASHQSQIYIKSMFKEVDVLITKPTTCTLEFNKDVNMWLFRIPEESRTSYGEAEEAGRTARTAIKKSKRREKNRRSKVLRKD